MEYQRNQWGTDDRFTGPDGQAFTKYDGMMTKWCDSDGVHERPLALVEIHNDDDGACDI